MICPSQLPQGGYRLAQLWLGTQTRLLGRLCSCYSSGYTGWECDF